LVVLAHKFVVMVFRVFVLCLWKKKVAGCWVEGAAALGIWFGAIAMAKTRTMRNTPFGPELLRIPRRFDSYRPAGTAYQRLVSLKIRSCSTTCVVTDGSERRKWR